MIVSLCLIFVVNLIFRKPSLDRQDATDVSSLTQLVPKKSELKADQADERMMQTNEEECLTLLTHQSSLHAKDASDSHNLYYTADQI